MKDPLSGAMNSFQVAAQAAGAAEQSFRKSIRPRLEALERERVFAYRRLNLVTDMAAAAAREATHDTAVAAVIACVAAGFALERGRDRHETILSRLTPVAEAVAAAVHPAPDDAEAIPDLAAVLAGFEAWYLAETGAHFLARADIAVPETPLVDW